MNNRGPTYKMIPTLRHSGHGVPCDVIRRSPGERRWIRRLSCASAHLLCLAHARPSAPHLRLRPGAPARAPAETTQHCVVVDVAPLRSATRLNTTVGRLPNPG
jgi:hypothetical protein